MPARATYPEATETEQSSKEHNIDKLRKRPALDHAGLELIHRRRRRGRRGLRVGLHAAAS